MSVRVEERYVHKDFPHSSHRTLAELVGEVPARVLDVGAATGFLGRVLSARGHTVVGVERDADAAALAAVSYAAFHVGDAASLPRLPEAPFDVIVAGDVLEHVADPASALVRLVEQLAPNGRIILSVPNVAFILMRLGLLAGRFDYTPRGILDATHLRFFTRRSALSLLSTVGLVVERVHALPPPLPLLTAAFARWPLRIVYEAAAFLARAWPTMFGYQLVFEARR